MNFKNKINLKENINEEIETIDFLKITNIELSSNGGIKKITIKSSLIKEKITIDLWEDRYNLSNIGYLIDLGYITIDNKYFFEVYFKKGDKLISIKDIIPVPKNKETASFYQYYILIENKKNLPLLVKEIKRNYDKNKINIHLGKNISIFLIKKDLSIKEKLNILFTAFVFMKYRFKFTFLYKNYKEALDIAKKGSLLEKLYGLGILTFPDILTLYFIGGFKKTSLNHFLNKILDIKYLKFQLFNKDFSIIKQNLIADYFKANIFLKSCKNIKECICIRDKTYFTRYNLYVRLDVIKKLYDEGVITEEDYNRYKQNILEAIRFSLEISYENGTLTLPDVLYFYLIGGYDRKDLILYFDKILDRKYLYKQLNNERLYVFGKGLWVDKIKAKKFISNCKILKNCFNTTEGYKNRYNLYVWLVVINNLYQKGIIPKENYEKYRQNIAEIINILEEIKNLEEEKKNEEDRKIKEIKERIDKFLMVP